MARIQKCKNKYVSGDNEVVKIELMNQRLLMIFGFIMFVLIAILGIKYPQLLWLDAFGGVIGAIKLSFK